MRTVYALALGVLLFGCGGPGAGPTAPENAVPSLAGVYQGTFPCADCPGIEATLWLRADGRFFSRRSYVDDPEAGPDGYNSGRWRVEPDGRIVVDGAGPDQVLTRRGPNRLELVTHSRLEHVLSRLEPAPAFADRFQVRAVAEQRGDGYVVTHCSTGLKVPLATGGDFPAFRRQFRSLGRRGEGVYIEFEGRFTWAGNGAPEALHIDRFSTVKRDSSC